MELSAFFKENPRVALAFSGGVDSAYLLYAAVQAGTEVAAYFVKSAFQPQFELEDAKRMAGQLGVSLRILEVAVLDDPRVTENPPDRCYYCKRRIFTRILEQARQDGYPVVLDGTNASDEVQDRPGMRALAELGIQSPLRQCGLTKAQIREASRAAGLFTAEKPAYACLATRIPTGTAITVGALRRTEQAETVLFSLGFSDFRVRRLQDIARIQVPAAQLERLLEKRTEVLRQLRPLYSGVVLDLEVRHGE